MNQVKPSEQVVGRVTTVSLSQLVARRLRATLVRGLTQTRFLLVLSDCDWLFSRQMFPLQEGRRSSCVCLFIERNPRQR